MGTIKFANCTVLESCVNFQWNKTVFPDRDMGAFILPSMKLLGPLNEI